jgi:hypothetical protein
MTSLPNNIGVLAPLWTNLALAPNGQVLYRFADTNGDNTPDYLIIEWSNVAHVLPGGGLSSKTGTFQVFLQLNTGTANGDIIYNYVSTDFGDTNSNFGANATVGIKDLTTANNHFTQLAFNPGPSSGIIQNFSNGHAVRFTSNAINVPPVQIPTGTTDTFGYRAFRSPFDSKFDILNATAAGQTTNVILGPGTFDNTTGFQSGPQSLQSTIVPVTNPPVVFGNTFNYYGTTYSTLSVSKNGFITLGGAAPQNSQNNTSLAANPTLATIAPLWSNWNNFSSGPGLVLGRFIDFDGNGIPEYLVIDWKNVQNGGINPPTAADQAIFQAVLQLNTGTNPGQIWFNYTNTNLGDPNFNNGANATVGIKNTNPTNGQFFNISLNQVSPLNPDLGNSRAIGVFDVSSASQTVTIQVNNVPPVLTADPNNNLKPNEGSTFTGTIFVTDPGILDNFTGSVDFGDGSTPTALALPAGTTSFQINHIYGHDRAGGYTVTVNLTDKDGGMANPLVFTVNVQNVPPTLTVAGAQLIKPGQVLVLDGTAGTPFLGTFTDPGFTFPPSGTSETFTTSVDWGDGSVVTVPPNTAQVSQTVVNGGPGVLTTGTIAARHLYSGRGLFTVKVTVTDNDGGFDIKTVQVSVGSTSLYAVAAGAGGTPAVRTFDVITRLPYLQFDAYDTRFRGGVRVATGDVNGDTLPDIVTAPGPGGGPDVRVFDNGTGLMVQDFYAFDPAFRGGVFVATGDVNHDGFADIICGAGPGGGPHVRVFDGRTHAILFDKMVFDPGFRGGVRVAAGDVNGDGFADIICAAGPGGGPQVNVYSGKDGSLLYSFLAYDGAFRGGVYVSAGDVNGDGHADVITGPGLGGGPHLKVFNLFGGGLIASLNAFPPGVPGTGQFDGTTLWSSGLTVGVTDLNRDGFADIIVGPGAGQTAVVKILDGTSFVNLLTGPTDPSIFFDPSFLGGVFVAGNAR